MKVAHLRTPRHETEGIVYVSRMLDKIRLHAAGQLPEEYAGNIGGGFDEMCCQFLRIDYPGVVERTKLGGTDEEILNWIFENGRRPDWDEIRVWNAFMTKRGWRDEASPRLVQRKAESGFTTRDDIQTFFDYIDADEGRELPPAPGIG
jgi:gluconokinase